MPEDRQRAWWWDLDLKEGRYVIARGNSDHARYIVVMISGIGARSPISSRTAVQRSAALFDKIASNPDDDTVSVITWADYIPPQSPREAKDPAFAVPGVRRLASFLPELRASNKQHGRLAEPARVTIIAHGYGGLVAGLAAREYGLDADALVFLGCAGAGVKTARDLRNVRSVYATSPDINGDGTPVGIHGPCPDNPEFGATVLRPGPLSFGEDPATRYVPALRRIVLGEY